ncbi:MAG: DHH family phosphoesterase, partial [Candidatus Omnitrophica bacterium]|nr:DHH family phosphoesterase [Candidatus Omnitrophota bacterium]
MQRRWTVKGGRPVDSLQKALRISPLLSLILANRGITTSQQAHGFLHGTLLDLESPWRIKNMDRVVSRLKQAITGKEKILIWGDYDVDGTTGASILFLTLKKMKGIVNAYIPHRIHDGYGLNLSGIQQAAADGVQLLITVDSGVTAKEEIQYAASQGIEVIVVDHHEPQKEKWPHEAVVINPLQEGCPSSFKQMTAAGLAFKVAWALLGREVFEYLELAAAGTVADMGPLVGENRILVRAGLERINQCPRAGLKALLSVARMGTKKVDAGHLAFLIGPRINAAGRMNSAEAALKLLTTHDFQEACELAQQLE